MNEAPEQPPLDPEEPKDHDIVPGSEGSSSETGTTPSDAPKIDPEYTDARRIFDISEKDMPEFFELYKSHRILRQAFFDNIKKLRPDQLVDEQEQIMTETRGLLNGVSQSFRSVAFWFFEDNPENYTDEISRLYYDDIVDTVAAAHDIIPDLPLPPITLEELKNGIKQTRDDYIRIQGGSFDIRNYVAIINNTYTMDLNWIALFTYNAMPCREAVDNVEPVATTTEPTATEPDQQLETAKTDAVIEAAPETKKHVILKELARAAITAGSIALGIIIADRLKRNR